MCCYRLMESLSKTRNSVLVQLFESINLQVKVGWRSSSAGVWTCRLIVISSSKIIVITGVLNFRLTVGPAFTGTFHVMAKDTRSWFCGFILFSAKSTSTASLEPAMSQQTSYGTFYLTTSTGSPYTYHNGVAYFHCSNINTPSYQWLVSAHITPI